MADDNGYIDENDLINDYYDDMEGDYNEEIDGVDESAPPPPSQPKKNETENDYDAFMNATMLEEEEPSPAANTLQVTTTASTLNQQNLISTVGHRRENVPSTVTLNMPSSKHDKLINRNTQTDVNSSLYGFERYTGKHEWRSITNPYGKNNADTTKENKWKQVMLKSKQQQRKQLESTQPKRGGQIWRNSPEAQLVIFLRRIASAISVDTVRGLRGGQSEDRFTVKHSVRRNMPVEGEKSVPVTSFDGTRLYISQSNPLVTTEQRSTKLDSLRQGKSLLRLSMSELNKRAEMVQRRMLSNKRHKISNDEVAHRNMGDPNVDLQVVKDRSDDTVSIKDSETKERECEEKVEKEKGNAKLQKLWVDKHAPNHFSDLLSEERSNREVLRALRAWDPFVFQKDPPPRPAIFQQFAKQNTLINGDVQQNDVNGDGSNDADNKKQDTRPDEHNRVILLSGPPGVGKTTMAVIMAKHAGYRPLEINASDDRTASVLTNRVINAMESTTLNVESKNRKESEMLGRPNCLILDEVDGADAKASILALIEIIRAEMPAKGVKGKNKKPYLRRPIIFICNHKYAPALRPLLQYARQFDIMPPSSSRLAARLKSVLTAENMTMSNNGMLHQLVAGSGGDIRSCLFTLQFASARAKEIDMKRSKPSINSDGAGKRRKTHLVDISPGLSTALGGDGRSMKDERSDITGTISSVFRKMKRKIRTGGNIAQHAERVLQVVECFGDNGKTLDCLFMNLLEVSYVDPTLDRCFTAHEWLSASDIYRSFKTTVASTNTTEHYKIQNLHIPTAAAAIHFLCCVETKPRLTFSTRPLQDSVYLLEANSGLVTKFLEGLGPKLRSGIQGSCISTEVIPFSTLLLSAGQGMASLSRSVSSLEILSKDERVAFKHHTSTLRGLGLTYVKDDESNYLNNDNENSNDISVQMRLEPEINKMTHFQNLNHDSFQEKQEVPSVLKELLAHATLVEGMRERERELSTLSRKDKSGNIPTTKGSDNKFGNIKPRTKSVPVVDSTILLQRSVKATDKISQSIKKPQNFLGIGAVKAKAARTARRKSSMIGSRSKIVKGQKLSNTGSGLLLDQVVRFKYQKGFTQAVRLPCRKDHLL